MTVTRRQHYVWRHYLSAWETNGNVSVLRKGRPVFASNPINIAVERDFYRLPVLSEDDETFARVFIEQTIKTSMLRDLALGWLKDFAAPSRLRRYLEASGVQDAEITAEIEKVEIQSEENLHSSAENTAISLLDALRNGQRDLWSIDEHAMDLAFFLSLQHLRTKNMRHRTVSGFPAGPIRERVEKIWPILRLVFATNMGWSLYSERENWRLRILNASAGLAFITGDQPTLNVLPGGGHYAFALYYPINPTRAIILEAKHMPSAIGPDDNIADGMVTDLNAKIFAASYEQVFGRNAQHLEQAAAVSAP
ncbi:DUF4238 domain-containing protein [Pararhizobium sp. LjRoot238]|uniref:DUF4238 domain-containing protein n=1 Tax=Pararhizobium sp. LjRoot238 TaxID=3342293 RepID=UPI003ED007CD